MLPDDSPVEVSLVMDWLRVTAEDLGARMEAVRAMRDRAERLAGLLVLEGVSPAEIEELLPAVVADSLRKVLGTGSPGGLLGHRRARTPALPRSTPPQTPVTDIADRLVGPVQRRVWQHLLTTSSADGPPRVFRPADVAAALADLGEPMHKEGVRKVLNRLTSLGGTRSVRPGQYQLTPDAIAYARAVPDDHPTASLDTTAQDSRL